MGKAWHIREELRFPLSTANLTAVWVAHTRAQLPFIFLEFTPAGQSPVIYAYQVDLAIISNFRHVCADAVGSVGKFLHSVLRPYQMGSGLTKIRLDELAELAVSGAGASSAYEPIEEPPKKKARMPSKTYDPNKW